MWQEDFLYRRIFRLILSNAKHSLCGDRRQLPVILHEEAKKHREIQATAVRINVHL
jgi:hypothetical protein